jgi:hypothetical protein
MDFGNACLFNKKPEDMRRVGALGGRARARNLRLLKVRRAPIARKFNQRRQETAAEAMRRIDALCPWLVGAERCVGRARAEERAMRTDVSCKENSRVSATVTDRAAVLSVC